MNKRDILNKYGNTELVCETYETKNIVYRGNINSISLNGEIYIEIPHSNKNAKELRLVESLINIDHVVDDYVVSIIDYMGNKIYSNEGK